MNPADKALTDSELAEMFSGEIQFADAMGFYLDANIHQGIRSLLEVARVYVTDAYIEGQYAEEADTRLLAQARGMGFVMVTHDDDLATIHNRLIGLELTHAGLIHVRSKTLKADYVQLANTLMRLSGKYEGLANALVNQVFTI